MKVISGGQTGVDQSALRAALDCGLPCGGWCPPGRSCESGVIPSRFPLQETPQERSPEALDIPRSQRTEWNVRDSDATLILLPSRQSEDDRGTDWARRCAQRDARPVLVCDPDDAQGVAKIERWLGAVRPRVLNVAGPAESKAPGIGEKVYLLLRKIFSSRLS